MGVCESTVQEILYLRESEWQYNNSIKKNVVNKQHEYDNEYTEYLYLNTIEWKWHRRNHCDELKMLVNSNIRTERSTDQPAK